MGDRDGQTNRAAEKWKGKGVYTERRQRQTGRVSPTESLPRHLLRLRTPWCAVVMLR